MDHGVARILDLWWAIIRFSSSDSGWQWFDVSKQKAFRHLGFLGTGQTGEILEMR